MFMASPLYGHGSEAFFLLAVDYGAPYGVLKNITPHSTYMKMATETGLIGVFSLVWLMGAVFFTGLGVRRVGGSERAVGTLLLTMGAAQLVSNTFHTGLLAASTSSSALWMMLGISTRLRFSPRAR